METIYRQIAPHRLTEAQRQAKLAKDSEYEVATQNLSATFYQKKRTVGVTAQEEVNYQTEKAGLWDTYYQWAIANSLYEAVTPEQQLTEAEGGLSAQVDGINVIRRELGKRELEVKEKEGPK